MELERTEATERDATERNRSSGFYPTAGAAEPAASYESLLRRYEAMTQQYGVVVRRNHELCEKLTSVAGLCQQSIDEDCQRLRLEQWTLRTSSIGSALVQGDQVRASNLAFANLEEVGRADAWRHVDLRSTNRNEPETYASLHALAIGLARKLRTSADLRLEVRFAKGARVVDMTVERRDLAAQSPVLVMVSDVTELANAEAKVASLEQQLARQDRLRATGERAIAFAHDLNNVLSALAMRLSLLRQDTSLAVSQKQNADAMARILRTCTTRLGTLRWFAIDPVDSADPVDLGDIVDGALEVVETLFDSARPVRAAVALPVLPTVKGCAAELCDVFVNLMINARDAMASGGTIRISGAIEPRYVMVAIEDEGPGIPPDHAERIFEPFFTTKGKGGTGLGLANARRTLQRFGGSIRATNRAGGGARFELRFVPRG